MFPFDREALGISLISRRMTSMRSVVISVKSSGTVYDRSTAFCQNVRMPNEYPLALRQADEARTDFALIEDHLEAITGQLARVPTRAYLCRMLLLATASIWALLALLLLR